MISSLKNIRFTTLMFVFISFILLSTIASLSITSIRSASSGLYELGDEALKTIHTSMINSLTALHHEIQDKLKSDLKFLEFEMMSGEELFISDAKTTVGSFELPVMMKGEHGVHEDDHYVDKITEETNAKATIFQLHDNKLIRISTSVIKKDGNRATGTYISADSPVYKTVMSGNTFLGKAFVVDDWYLTAYSPLYDKNKEIIGAVFVGGVMLNKAVKELISSTKMGPGYFFVYDYEGVYRVHPTLGSDKNVFDFLPQFREHKGGFITYEWDGVEKISYIDKFEEWEVWVGIGMNHHDIIGGVDRKLISQSLMVGAVALVVGMILCFTLIRLVNGRVQSIAQTAAEVGKGDYTVKFNIQSKDALGSLSSSLNEMVSSSNTLLSEINSS